MKWYYKTLGGHTHVRVFMNGGKCGDLCFRNEEFEEIRRHHETCIIEGNLIAFVPDPLASPHITCPYCKMTSYNPSDIAQRYCGNCHRFLDAP